MNNATQMWFNDCQNIQEYENFEATRKIEILDTFYTFAIFHII